jgi:hypothetical protein
VPWIIFYSNKSNERGRVITYVFQILCSFYEVKIQSFIDGFHPLLVSCLCYAAHRFERVLVRLPPPLLSFSFSLPVVLNRFDLFFVDCRLIASALEQVC